VFFISCRAHAAALMFLKSRKGLLVKLLVIAKEDLDWQPVVSADLESILQSVQLADLLVRQVPAVKFKVQLDTLLVDTLWDHAPSLLETPHEENLLGGLALVLSQGEKGLVLVERRVGGTEARVAGAVDTLAGVVCDELWRWVVWVEFDLVHCWHNLSQHQHDSQMDDWFHGLVIWEANLGAWVVEELLKVLDSKV
jgi:hypothetical protein